MSRPVRDLDQIVAEREGCPIAEIFARRGEAAFRRIETEILADVSKESGIIIATGGGVVTQPRNRPLLRQNGICVWLDRAGELPVDGRPLSQSVGVEELRRRRLPLYRAWADLTVRGSSAQDAAAKIKEALQL